MATATKKTRAPWRPRNERIKELLAELEAMEARSKNREKIHDDFHEYVSRFAGIAQISQNHAVDIIRDIIKPGSKGRRPG